MSTPDQPNDENRSLSGPARNGTESVPGPRPNSAQGAHPESAPSGRPERPLQPRPISRRESAKQQSPQQQGGDQPSTQSMAKPDGREEQAARQPLPKRPTGGGQNGRPRPVQTPPWQREPQSNLYRPGQSPVQGRPPSDRSGSGALSAAASAAAAATSDVDRADRKQVNRSKSAVIDGPTRSLARPEQPKDMPDLSDTRHPVPAEHDTSARQKKGGAAAAIATPEPLRATVQIRKLDPWSVLQVSLVISAALFFVWMAAVGLLYVVLDGMGVWDRLNNAFTDIVSDSSSGGLISASQVFGYAAVIGLINAVLMTALATIGSFIYNQCSDLVGGIQVTLADPD